MGGCRLRGLEDETKVRDPISRGWPLRERGEERRSLGRGDVGSASEAEERKDDCQLTEDR